MDGWTSTWEFRMPRPANPIDYRSIADILITIDYTALDSPLYRQEVVRGLDPVVGGDRRFSLHRPRSLDRLVGRLVSGSHVQVVSRYVRAPSCWWMVRR